MKKAIGVAIVLCFILLPLSGFSQNANDTLQHKSEIVDIVEDEPIDDTLSVDTFQKGTMIIQNAYLLAPEFSFGFATGKELRHSYTFGQRVGLYVGFPIPRTGLNIGPEIQYTHFGNYINKTSVNHNHTGVTGLRTMYFFVPTQEREVPIFPIASIGYMFGSDLIKPRKHYVGATEATYTFKGFAVTAGIGFEVYGFSMRLTYEVNRVNGYLSERIMKETAANIQQNFPSLFTDLFSFKNPTKMNFDKVLLTFTYNIHLKNISP